MQKISQEQAQRMLISEVAQEVEKYEKEQFWITDKIALNLREAIREFRKNYWGIYDEPNDPITGKEKHWVPLTRMLVDAVRKNVNLDPKDVRFRAKNANFTGITHMVRGFMRDWLSKNYFNHTLNQTTFKAAVDGTAVWKTYVFNGKVIRKDVDLLNVYIDPTAESIQDAFRFTERLLMTKEEVRAMDWENTDEFATEEDLEKNGDGETRKQGEFGDVYESWGKYPKYLVLAAMGMDYSEADMNENVESQIVISGLDTGRAAFHYAEENKKTDKNGEIIKPYEEAWYTKVPDRWYGVGVAETVLSLQYWINTVVNLRIKKNTISQLGLLKIRRGSKVTQQMLQNLIGKGVIELADPERDLQQLNIAESGQSSYADEENAKGWAQDVTSIFDSSLGDLPASTSATGAVIQDRQQRSAFQLVTESMEYMLQRWIDRHVLPNMVEVMDKEDYIPYFKDFDDIKRVRRSVIATEAMKALETAQRIPTEEELRAEIAKAERKLEDMGDLFIERMEDIIAKGLETEVFMTNAEVDVAVTVRNLLELRNGLPPQAAMDMTAEAMDLLGLEVPDSLREPAPQPQAAPEEPLSPGGPVTEQGLTTDVLTLGGEQR